MFQPEPMANPVARIVIVDNDASDCGTLVTPLQALVPTAITCPAPSGREALELLRQGPCDLLLIDVASAADLAEDSEEALMRLVRPATGALVIVLSDAGGISAAIGAMRAGAHEFVSKPIDPIDFQTRVLALARRHGRTALLPRTPQWTSEPSAVVPSPFRRTSSALPPVLPMWRQEQRIIEDAIRHFAGNITMAAAALELSPSTIYRKRQAWAEMEERKGAA